ncbi:MAG TPA: DUF2249 domain-containing protein [Streptosporangiaceae bacterium]|nr:DUF2249 domain-containing protein [Streptosporangiaceae bacterium]
MATVDARPIIAAGGEPFDTIMAAVAGLTEGEELVVLAPFEPVPLEGVLGSQGFTYEAADLGGDWQVTFRRES